MLNGSRPAYLEGREWWQHGVPPPVQAQLFARSGQHPQGFSASLDHGRQPSNLVHRRRNGLDPLPAFLEVDSPSGPLHVCRRRLLALRRLRVGSDNVLKLPFRLGNLVSDQDAFLSSDQPADRLHVARDCLESLQRPSLRPMGSTATASRRRSSRLLAKSVMPHSASDLHVLAYVPAAGSTPVQGGPAFGPPAPMDSKISRARGWSGSISSAFSNCRKPSSARPVLM